MDDPAAAPALVPEVRAHLAGGDPAALRLVQAGGEVDVVSLEDFARAALEDVRTTVEFAERPVGAPAGPGRAPEGDRVGRPWAGWRHGADRHGNRRRRA
jgi:hypothetical protein